MIIKIFGDSHSRIFKKINLNKYDIDVESISGASLSGLTNKNSQLQVKNKILNYLQNNKPSFLILKFGQVDIDLQYYFKIVMKNQKINKEIYIRNMINNYIKFIHELSKIYPKNKIIIYGINPPSLIDKQKCFEYTLRIIAEKNINEDIKTKLLNNIESIQQRTSFSKLFNDTCKYYCNKNNIKYTEVFHEMIENNIIMSKYTNNNDHHIKGIENENSNFEPTNSLFKKSLINIIQ